MRSLLRRAEVLTSRWISAVNVARFFHALDDERLLDRLQIVAVRLLGCQTAVTDAGQRSLRMLSRTLRLLVFGNPEAAVESHCNAHGFDPRSATS